MMDEDTAPEKLPQKQAEYNPLNRKGRRVEEAKLRRQRKKWK